MVHFKDFLRIILDAFGLSLNSMLAAVGWIHINTGVDIESLKTGWDWAFFIGDILRVTIMSLLSIGFLIFRIYVEYRRFKKEHAPKDESK